MTSNGIREGSGSFQCKTSIILRKMTALACHRWWLMGCSHPSLAYRIQMCLRFGSTHQPKSLIVLINQAVTVTHCL